jgi:hypothetical protein
MKDQTPKKIPIRWAIFWIFLSVLLFSGTVSAIFYYFDDQKYQRLHNPAYNIFAIVQSTLDKETLKTSFLAEFLDLSVNQPTNLYQFSSKEAELKLNTFPLIKVAHVKKIHPGIIHIDYSLRKPIAILADYSNTLIDSEGIPFPLKPFFTPKKLPKIYLGIDEQKVFEWGKQIEDQRFLFAKEILQYLPLLHRSLHTHISLIDVSKAFASSYGERQIVLVEEQEYPFPSRRFLRLSTENYVQNLTDYIQMKKVLALHSAVIDLRIPQLAYLQTLP